MHRVLEMGLLEKKKTEWTFFFLQVQAVIITFHLFFKKEWFVRPVNRKQESKTKTNIPLHSKQNEFMKQHEFTIDVMHLY